MNTHLKRSTIPYPSDRWGALAKNPGLVIGANGPGWRSAVKSTWLANGGTEADFFALFPQYAPEQRDAPRPR
jgi:hypothetical protein